jgi:hypothetical protein
MTLLLRIVVAVVSVAFLFFILLQVRRQKMLLRLSFFWLVLGLAGILTAAFPGWIIGLAHLLGFEAPSNFVFFVCIIILLGVCLTLGAAVSRLTRRVASLVQEISLLKEEVDQRDRDRK